MIDDEDSNPDRYDLSRRPQSRVEAARAPEPAGIDPEMIAFGLKLAFGVAMFQLSLATTVFGHFTRG